MKVVITTDWTFAISREGWLWLLDHGFDPAEQFPSCHYPDEFIMDNTYYTDESQRQRYQEDLQDGFGDIYAEICDETPFNPYESFESYLKYCVPYFVEIPRHHPLLVQMVEELGDRASHCRDSHGLFPGNGFKIVEIPDGTNYVIDQYDGNYEFIRERSKTWC